MEFQGTVDPGIGVPWDWSNRELASKGIGIPENWSIKFVFRVKGVIIM